VKRGQFLLDFISRLVTSEEWAVPPQLVAAVVLLKKCGQFLLY
jgi:hypothetical protein